MMGKPVIRATRIALELIVPRIAEGASEAQLLEDYPHLTREEIRAYGAASVAHEEVLFLPDTPTKTKSNLRPPRPPRSLISQGDHRIDARRAARRYVTGERRHRRQHQRHNRERERIARPDSVKELREA